MALAANGGEAPCEVYNWLAYQTWEFYLVEAVIASFSNF
jgi:hypothetical protein